MLTPCSRTLGLVRSVRFVQRQGADSTLDAALAHPPAVLARLLALQQSRSALLASGAGGVGQVRAGAEALLDCHSELSACKFEGSGGPGDADGDASEMELAAKSFDNSRRRVNELAVQRATDVSKAVDDRTRSAERLRAAASGLVQRLGPSAQQRAQRLALLTSVAVRTAKHVALLPAPPVRELATVSMELPTLGEGAGSATAMMEQAYTTFQACWEREAELELRLRKCVGLWQPVDEAAYAQWEQAVHARENAGCAMGPCFRAVEAEHTVVFNELVAAAHALGARCKQEVEDMTAELVKQGERAEHSLARARALLDRAHASLQAQVDSL
jgi:hypothetical protein